MAAVALKIRLSFFHIILMSPVLISYFVCFFDTFVPVPLSRGRGSIPVHFKAKMFQWSSFCQLHDPSCVNLRCKKSVSV